MRRAAIQRPAVRRPLFGLATLLLAGWLPVMAAGPHTADGWYAAGQGAMKAGQFRQAAVDFAQAAALNPSAANWRWLGEAHQKSGDTAAAAAAFDRAIALYRSRGDVATANALDHRVAPLRQTTELRLLGAPGAPDPACNPLLARLEPAGGLLMGTYVSEANLNRPADGAPRLSFPAASAPDFAVYFRYFSLLPAGQGEVFPTRFIQAVRAAGGAAHLAVEPRLPLAQVTEASVLPFAQAARASGVPIYLRFAGEMNDPANAWSRDPAAYRAAFARVARVMHRTAPNVAMVWMPMASRLESIGAYYPGADSVDWAGLSLYSVPFENGQLARPNDAVHPTDLIEGFYRRYACRHPIQLSEYAASHRSQAAPDRDFTAFALQQMRETYWGAMLHFPRLKNINWLDLDMTTATGITKSTVRLNDYRLYAVPAKLSVLSTVLGEPYFRASVTHPVLPLGSQAWPAIVTPVADQRGAVWLKTAAPVQALTLTLDGRPVLTEETLPYRFTLARAALGLGAHILKLDVTLENGGRITQTQTFTVR